MIIVGHHQQPEKPPADGLPPLPELPPCDGRMPGKFVGRRTTFEAWSSEAMVSFAKQYGRTCAATLDLEIAALTAERDVLKARLEELQAS